MHRIGDAKGIRLYAPKDAYFSYFNSPYFAHSHASAIDIYPHHQEWGGPVLAPVSGKIVRLQKTTMGRQKEFPTEDFDFGIAIQPEENDDAIVRILHCTPTLQEGNPVELGDMIGTTIRSRYFNYWTGPHYHVEVMKLDSFSRSTQSFTLQIPFLFESRKSSELKKKTEFVVSIVNEDHIIGYPKNFSHTQIGNYIGLSAIDEHSNNVGILDGGISHYKHGGVVGHDSPSEGSTIRLQNYAVGTLQQILHTASFFTRGPTIKSFLDDLELLGLSCFMYPKEYNKQGIPPLILIPKEYREFIGKVSEGDVRVLSLEVENNTVKAE